MNNKEGNETLSVQKFPRVSHRITAIHFVEYHDQSGEDHGQLPVSYMKVLSTVCASS